MHGRHTFMILSNITMPQSHSKVQKQSIIFIIDTLPKPRRLSVFEPQRLVSPSLWSGTAVAITSACPHGDPFLSPCIFCGRRRWFL